MNRKKWAVLVTSAVAVGIAIYLLQKNRTEQKQKRRQMRVSDEGYETAEDILYPLRNQRRKFS